MSLPQRAISFVKRHPDIWIAAALAIGTVVVVGITADSVGFTRDEGYYFKAAKTYAGWFRDVWRLFGEGRFLEPFSASVIDRHWSYNHEHPALVKTTMALSWLWLKENLGLFALHSSAIRFPAWCFAGLSVGLVYLLARALLPRRTSLLAAALWLSMPRAYWHMHLACFDIAVCAAHLWLVLAYLRCRFSTGGAFMIAAAFALAAAVKHNVLVAPAFFVLHWGLTEARGYAAKATGFQIPRVPLAFFALAFLSPLLFILHWPYLWPDVFKRIGFWLGFHLTHEHYPILWFGDLLTKPPFPVSFPFVMSAVTIPVPVLVVMLLGVLLATWVAVRHVAAHLWRAQAPAEITRVPLGQVLVRGGHQAREPSGIAATLLLLNAAFPFVLIALPSSPIFGGTKHWMNALPFLCILGAWAVEEALAHVGAFLRQARQIERRKTERLLMAAFAFLSLLVVTPGFLLCARVHPYGLSSYNALIGYARGAANTGMQRTFWGYEPRLALPLINARAKPGSIHFGDTNRDDYKAYVADGLLRKDLRFTGGTRGVSVASVQPQGEFKQQWTKVLRDMEVDGPDHIVHIEGVPLAAIVFKNDRPKPRRKIPPPKAPKAPTRSPVEIVPPGSGKTEAASPAPATEDPAAKGAAASTKAESK